MNDAGAARPRLLNPHSTAALVMGAHDWTQAGLGLAPSFLRSAERVIDYLCDSDGLGLHPKLVLNLFDNEASGGDQLAHILEFLDLQLRDRRETGRPITDVLVYYIGHGHTDDQNHLCLLVRRSRRGVESATGIKAPDFAHVLRRAAPKQRRSIVLDCCFSEAAARAFIGMSGDLNQRVGATAANDFGDKQPIRGTILLCSSPTGVVSIGPPDAECTLFTGAVIDVLKEGVPGRSPFLSFADLRDAAFERMVMSFGASTPSPVLHQVNAAHGDLTRAPAFPNRILANMPGMFGGLVSFAEKNGNVRVPPGYKVNGKYLARWITHQRSLYHRGALTIEQVGHFEALRGWGWSWDPKADQFEQGFAILRSFVADHGNARVPRSAKVDGFPLGVWVTERRAAYKKGILPATQIQRFERLKGWVWNPRSDAFEKWFALLKDFVEVTGHASPASDYKIGKMRLGRWVVKQRHSYNRGNLPKEKIGRLQALKGWSWDLFEDVFETHFSVLQRYVASHGNALVPQRYRRETIRLGGWVNERRLEYRQSRLPPEKICRLEQLRGWSWDPVKDQLERGFAHLEFYVAQHGSARVPVSCIVDGFKLGEWVRNRRQFHRKGILAQEQVARLEALPGWTWTPFSDAFESGFARLQAYAALNGHCRLPPARSADELNLRSWINRQRTEYRKGKLSPDRICRLESVVGWVWSQLDEQFEQGFAQLEVFVAKNGPARVTKHLTVDGFKLGSWIISRRREYTQGKLSEKRIRRLESVPGWKW